MYQAIVLVGTLATTISSCLARKEQEYISKKTYPANSTETRTNGASH
jgi:hypothetical protein